MTDTTADQIMTVLVVDASAGRKAALQRLKQACDVLEKRGPIKLAAIEFFLKSTLGTNVGPRAQSISNERTRAIGMYHYVAARNRERVIPERQRGSRAKGGMVRQIELIPDMDLRVAMRDVFDRMNVAEAHLSRAKHLLKTVQPGLDVEVMMTGRQPKVGASLDEAAIACLKVVVGTLRDPEKLRVCGLSCDHGAVQRRTGTKDELFSAQTITAVAALINDYRTSPE